MEIEQINSEYKNLFGRISEMYAQTRENAVSAVNRYLVESDWQLECSFYEKQTVLENWSTRELKRQKKPRYFYAFLIEFARNID